MPATLRLRLRALHEIEANARLRLAELDARAPHLALGVTGRRLQKAAEDARAEIAKVRDLLVIAGNVAA